LRTVKTQRTGPFCSSALKAMSWIGSSTWIAENDQLPGNCVSSCMRERVTRLS
jgi:hypothetical protein